MKLNILIKNRLLNLIFLLFNKIITNIFSKHTFNISYIIYNIKHNCFNIKTLTKLI